jgi:hypothetical protein
MEYLLLFLICLQNFFSNRLMVEQDSEFIKLVVEVGTAIMFLFSLSIVTLVYYFYGRLLKQKHS